MNGTYLGISSLTTEFFYCKMPTPFTDEGGGSSISTKWLQYGYNEKIEYICDISSLFTKETFFYDLYILDKSSETFYPVPVRVRNLISEDGEEVNANLNPKTTGDDVFVRRFFLYDTIS